MKISFKNEYISIKDFSPVVLPGFTVLTGLNGSGKSHLLKAIHNGSVILDNISQNEVAYFNYNDFIVDSKISNNQNEINDFTNKVNSNKSKLFEVYQNKKQQLASKIQSFDFLDYSIASLILENNKFDNVFGKDKKRVENFIRQNSTINYSILTSKTYQSFNISEKFYGFLNNYLSRGGNVQSLKFDEIKDRFSEVNKIMLSEISQDKTYYAFLRRNTPKRKNIFNLEINDFENTSLFAFEISEEIKSYKIEYQENKNTRKFTNKEFRQKFGDDPLKTINSVLDEYDCNGYCIESSSFTPSYKVDNLKTVIPITLKHKTELYETTLDQISSGEKTLMAIAFMIYKLKKNRIFPRVLLLDEIDSALHPSMTKRLLEVIVNLFVNKNKIKVIFVTHSPTTIAIAPENSIFIINKTGLNKIEKKTKEDALQILSEGYASLSQEDSDCSISYMIETSNKNSVVLTEGIIDKIIIETAWGKLYKKKMSFYVQDCFDAYFLANIIKRGDDTQDGIFAKYQDKTFVAIFDFDKTGYNSWNSIDSFNITDDEPLNGLTRKHKTKNEYAILLPVSKDKTIQKQVIDNGKNTFTDESHLPIELLFYGPKKLNKYFKRKNSIGGGKHIEFSYDKRKFANLVKTLPKSDFKNFIPLFKKLNSLFISI